MRKKRPPAVCTGGNRGDYRDDVHGGRYVCSDGGAAHILLCILLAVPGFLGWALPYFLYNAGVRRQTEKITPLIEEKYDEIYEICRKGNKLL